MLRVKDLIGRLSDHDPEAFVFMEGCDCYGYCDGTRIVIGEVPDGPPKKLYGFLAQEYEKRNVVLLTRSGEAHCNGGL